MPRSSSATASTSASMIPRDLVWCIEELAAFGADAKVLTALLGTSAVRRDESVGKSTTTTGEVEERIGRTLALVSVRETCDEMVGRRGEAWVPTMMDEDEDEDAERCVGAFETVADVLPGIGAKEDGSGVWGFCIDVNGESYEAYASAAGEATLVIENMSDATAAESFAVKCGVAERRGPMNKRKKEPPAFRMKTLAMAIDGFVREMFTSSKMPTSLSLVQKSAADARRLTKPTPTQPIEPTPKPKTIEPKPKTAPKATKNTETTEPVARGWNDVGQRPAVAPKPSKKTMKADETTKQTDAPKPSKRPRDAEETMSTPPKQMKTSEAADKPDGVVVTPTRRLLGNVVSAVSRTLSWASRRKSVDGVGTPVKSLKSEEKDLPDASSDDEEEDIIPTQVAHAPPSDEDDDEEEELENEKQEDREDEAPESDEPEEDAKMTQADEELETPTATQRMDELPTQPVRIVPSASAEEVTEDDIEDVEPPLPSSPPGGSGAPIRAKKPLSSPFSIAPRQPPAPKIRRRNARWQPDEVVALEAGVARHGVGSWAIIHQAYSHIFERHGRSQVDLKDKWRNLEKARAKKRAI